MLTVITSSMSVVVVILVSVNTMLTSIIIIGSSNKLYLYLFGSHMVAGWCRPPTVSPFAFLRLIP